METATYTEAWTGMIIITGVSPSVAFDGTVDYSYTYQGTNALTVPTA
jgi:RNA polymerase subunit RPABC4/transcription elongation factor Spt4